MGKSSSKGKYIGITLGAALIYSFSVPCLTLFGGFLPSILQGSFMYFGATIAMLIFMIISKFSKAKKEERLTKKELPYLIAITLTDMVSSVLLMYGLKLVSSDVSSLLLSFQTIMTALIAVIFFKERLGLLGWIGLGLILASSIALNISDKGFTFNYGCIFILIPCVLWGIQNNLSRKISYKDPKEIIFYKSLFTGISNLIISSLIGETLNSSNYIYGFYTMLLGMMTYGLAIMLYIIACRGLGTGIASSFFGINPFLGSLISIMVFSLIPTISFYISGVLMVGGMIVLSFNSYRKEKKNKLTLKS